MTQTFNDSVQILGTQDALQLNVQAALVQTQPLQVWQTNSGSALAQVTADGRFQIGTTFSGAADALLQVNYAPNGTQALSAWHAAGTVANPGTPVNWVFHELQLAGTVPISTLQNGLYTKLTHNNTGAGTAAVMRAATFQAINQTGSGAAPIGQVTGLRATASNAGTAYLGTAVALEAALTNDTGGSITTAIAFSVVPPVNAGTISALYGLQVADLTQGTVTNYALYTGRGAAHFGDNLELQVAPMGTVGNPPTNFVKVYPKLVTGSPHLFAKDASGTEYDLSSGGGAGTSTAQVCNGRLTLTSGTPVTTSDVTGATTLYFTPYLGNQIGTYNGSAWNVSTFTEKSLSLAGLTVNTVYDIFIVDSTLALESLAWNAQSSGAITGVTNVSPPVVTSAVHGLAVDQLITIVGVVGATGVNGTVRRISAVTTNTFTLETVNGNNLGAPGAYTSGGTWTRIDQQTTRATALVLQDGVLVKSGAATRRYLGTIRITTTAGQCEDSLLRRFVWNQYNKVIRPLLAQESASSWGIGGGYWRGMNNNLSDRIEVVIGQADFIVDIRAMGTYGVSNTAVGVVGIGLNRITSTNSSLNSTIYVYDVNTDHGVSVSQLTAYPTSGYNYYQAIEAVLAGSGFTGYSGGGQTSGISGVVMI